jgi:hypothetical protein
MPNPLTHVILVTIAQHLRRCAVLTDDPHAVDIIMTCARQLDDRAEQIRQRARKETKP